MVQSHKNRCWNKEAVLQNWTGTLSPVVTFVSVPNVNFSCPDTAKELKLSLSTAIDHAQVDTLLLSRYLDVVGPVEANYTGQDPTRGKYLGL